MHEVTHQIGVFAQDLTKQALCVFVLFHVWPFVTLLQYPFKLMDESQVIKIKAFFFNFISFYTWIMNKI